MYKCSNMISKITTYLIVQLRTLWSVSISLCIYIPALNSQAHAQSYIMENWHPSHTLSHTNRDTPRIAPLHRVQYILTFELQIMSSWTFSDPRFPPAQNLHYARNVMNIQCVLPNSGLPRTADHESWYVCLCTHSICMCTLCAACLCTRFRDGKMASNSVCCLQFRISDTMSKQVLLNSCRAFL